MNIEEKMMPIDEWNKQFGCKYMQQPISFLTEENLDRLQQHCEKTIQYGNGRILEEHQVTLELIIRYRELKQELEKEKKKNKEHKERITFLENKIYNQKQIIKYGVKTVKLNVDNLCKNFDLISKAKIKEIIYGDYEDLEIILMIKRLIDKEE